MVADHTDASSGELILIRKRVAKVAAAVAAGLLLAVGLTAPASASATYYTWATSVNVRFNFSAPEYCWDFPGPTRCPTVVDQVNPWDPILVICQHEPGEVVGGNPYWLWVYTPRGVHGLMTSYYIDYPYNYLPNVPDC